MPDPTYEAESLHTFESIERDFRMVGHEWKGKEMTERVDSETVEAALNNINNGLTRQQDLLDIRALLAEREALEAENQRLREALTEIERLYYTEGRETRWRAAHMCGGSNTRPRTEG